MRIEPRIVVASLFGLFIVGGSWYYSNQQPSILTTEDAAPTLNQDAPRNFIPVYDRDQNSIPDWQDTFAFATVEVGDISTGTPYVPQTKTGELALELARTAMAVDQSSSQNFDKDLFIQETLSSLSEEIEVEQYSEADIVLTTDNSPEAWKAYGNQVAAIIFDNAMEAEVRDELDILNDALTRNNPKTLEELEPRIVSYQSMVEDMLALPVPASLSEEHLSLLNTYQNLLSANQAFRNVFNDALPSMIWFQRYLEDSGALYTAIINLYQKQHEAGIQWNESDVASRLIVVE